MGSAGRGMETLLVEVKTKSRGGKGRTRASRQGEGGDDRGTDGQRKQIKDPTAIQSDRE